MVVSAGTYVRAVVRDLGLALGCGAAVASLRRTAIGPLTSRRALTFPAERSSWGDAFRSRLIPLDAMPLDLPVDRAGSAGDAHRFAAGGVVPIDTAHLRDASLVAVRDDGGRLLGVGDASHGNRSASRRPPQETLSPDTASQVVVPTAPVVSSGRFSVAQSSSSPIWADRIGRRLRRRMPVALDLARKTDLIHDFRTHDVGYGLP